MFIYVCVYVCAHVCVCVNVPMCVQVSGGECYVYAYLCF